MNEQLAFLFVGDGPLRAPLEAEVARENLQERVRFVGRRNNVANILRASYCLALPSRWEGMPNVVLEAMAAGLPVIATRVEGTSELIVDGETGLLISPGSSEELARAIGQSLGDERRRSEMIASAQGIVRKQFTWDAVVASYVKLYRELLRN
jgi:glycosyltransferase involved in cell wall biosynthesis